MSRIARLIALAAVTSGALATPALAQPGASTPGAAPVPIAPAPAAPVAEVPHKRFAVGLTLGGMSLASTEDPENEVGLGGAGLELRWRFARRWEAAVTLAGLTGELDEATLRKTGSLRASMMFHLRPERRWNVYLIGGLGHLHTQIVDKNSEESLATLAEAEFHLGAGVERRWHRFSVGAELQLVGTRRDDEAHDGPAFVGTDRPVPPASGGAMFNLKGAYHF
jgi:hypothetical protein